MGAAVVVRWRIAGTVVDVGSSEQRRVTVYTDGAAKGNPGPAGWCWWISDRSWASGGWLSATNNAAELTAVREALEALAEWPEMGLVVVTDSRYVLDTLSRWIHGYRRNGWKTSKGAPVANAELIVSIDELIRARGGVDWQWQRGHVGAHGNTQADAGASAAAESFRKGLSCPSGPGLTPSPTLLAQREQAES